MVAFGFELVKKLDPFPANSENLGNYWLIGNLMGYSNVSVAYQVVSAVSEIK